MSPSLTLDELQALLWLLSSCECCDKMASTLQTAASKLQELAQGCQSPLQSAAFGSEGVGTQVPVQTQTLAQGTLLGPSQTLLTIRLPARRPRSPSLDRDETRPNCDPRRRLHPPDPQTTSRRCLRRKATRCKRGAVRPPSRKSQTKTGFPSEVCDFDMPGDGSESAEEGSDVFSATEARLVAEKSTSEPNSVGDRVLQSLTFLTACAPLPETQVLPKIVNTLLQIITIACDEILASKEESRAVALIEALQGHHTFVERVPLATAEDSLENLAMRCHTADQNVAVGDFLYMLSTIHLRVRVTQEVMLQSKTRNKIMEEIRCDRVKRTSLWRYFHDGGKFALLAGGGTILLLIIIASAKLRARIRDRELTEDMLLRFVSVLRCPAQDVAGQHVRISIIPAIAVLRERRRPTFSTLFSPHLLIGHSQVFNNHMTSSLDLDVSDYFLNSIILRAILKPRCKISWAPCYTSALPKSTTLQLPDSTFSPAHSNSQAQLEEKVPDSTAPLFIINTGFDCRLKENLSTAGRYHQGDPKDEYRYTESQRKYAEQAVKISSMSDLRQKITRQLESGRRLNDSAYVEITHDVLEGQRLRINMKDGEFASIVLPDMPAHLRMRLMDVLKLAFQGLIKPVDSEEQGDKFSYPSIHFSWYNKYCFQGRGARREEEPAAYECRKQATTGKGRRVKTSFAMPYTTSELQEYSEEYVAVSEALAPIFDWLFTTLKQLIPSEMEIVGQFAEVLPADGECPAAPFAGFVINFNVATRIHRDNDRGFCVVLIISENCQGGDLCLEELGIRLKLANGDVVVFPSQKISHFNTHFKGERISVVFHTDADSKAWIEHRNHWKHSLFMLEPGGE